MHTYYVVHIVIYPPCFALPYVQSVIADLFPSPWAQLSPTPKGDEGYRSPIHIDTQGHVTVGSGHRFSPSDPGHGKPAGTEVTDGDIYNYGTCHKLLTFFCGIAE